MNFLRSSLARRNVGWRFLRVSAYSTEVTMAETSPPRDTLHRRIMRAGDPTVSIVDVVNKWVGEGKPVHPLALSHSLRTLRKFRRCKHALQLMEWLIDNGTYVPKSPDFAVQLDLIGKVRGLEEAEKFFEGIPKDSRDFKVYGALLSCYALKGSVEQAEAVMQTMKKMGLMRLLSYNMMLNLYSRTQRYEKMDELLSEMKVKGQIWDNYTYNTRLSAYVSASDLDGMEKWLSRMEDNPSLKLDWNTYVVVAHGYVKFGLPEKATAMVKKAEKLITIEHWKRAFEILLTTYGQIGNKDDLYQLWEMYKKRGKFDNTTYLAMISALAKLDDVAGVEKIVEEWEYKKVYYDLRIPRFLISTYCKHGFLDKAEAYMSRLVEIGEEPDATIWNTLASGYERNKEIPKALEALKKAISVSKPGWRPQNFTLASCLDYLKEKGEVEAAQGLLRSLREKGIMLETVYDTLLDYVNNGDEGSSRAINRLDARNRSKGSVPDEQDSNEV